MTKSHFIILFTILIGLFSCTKDLLNTNIEYDFQGQEWAAPLINTKLTVNRIVKESKGNIALKLDTDGKATIQYRGEVLRENSAKIFPPLPFVEPFYLLGDTTSINLFPDNPNNVLIKNAVFRGTNIGFVIETRETEDIDVSISIPEVSRNGQLLNTQFTVPHKNGNIARYETPQINIDRWTINTQGNFMTFVLEARKKDGSKAQIEQAYMTYDFIRFSYIEGYHGFHRFPIKGNVIDINLFNNWLSGGFDFQDPKISIIVDNSFGIPVRTEVERLELTSINGNTVNLQSDFIRRGIDFLYPSFDEIGQVKTTVFSFDKDNSNIRELFNEKTKTVTYEINALINPDRDTSINGFITDNGFYVVNVAAEIPLNGSVKELVITDTLDFSLEDLKQLERAEFKTLIAHDFPAHVHLDIIFIDNDGEEIDRLFDTQGIRLEPASLLPSGRTRTTTQKVFFTEVDQNRYNKIQNASKIVLLGYVNTTGSQNFSPLWIYGDYGFDIKVGVKAQLKSN